PPGPTLFPYTTLFRSSNFGGGAEIVTPECGRLVPPGDADELANCLTTLLTDESLRRRLSQAGPARAALLCDPERQVRALGEAVRSESTRLNSSHVKIS